MLAISELGDASPEWARVRAGYESLAPLTKRDSDLDYFRARGRVDRTFLPDIGGYHHHPVKRPTTVSQHG